MDIEKDSNREAFEAWFESRYDAHFMQFALDLDMYADKHTQTCWEAWQAAKANEAEKLKGCVVVPLENVRFFSNDGENYQTHETLEEAKHEAECAIEYYSDRLADQQLDPRSDGNFQQISYGIVLAGSSYSVDHIVTQQDIDDGEYSYDVGTEIMSLFLVEAVRGGNEN